MPNDTPFVDLPQPPRSFAQPPADADVRGDDYASKPTDDEYTRAIAYRDQIRRRVLAMNKLVAKLKGSREAHRALLHKTLPLADSSPPHYDGP